MIKIILKNGVTIAIDREVEPETEQRDFMELVKDRSKEDDYIVWKTKEGGFVTVREKEIASIAFTDESPDSAQNDFMSDFFDILSDKILDRAEADEE